MRARYTRFNDAAVVQHNNAIVDALAGVAAKKGITPAQLCIAWVKHLGSKVVPLPGSSKASRVLENLAAGDIQLTPEEVAEIDRVIESHPALGDRYFGGSDAAMHLWG